jgi:hypothetical protein
MCSLCLARSDKLKDHQKQHKYGISAESVVVNSAGVQMQSVGSGPGPGEDDYEDGEAENGEPDAVGQILVKVQKSFSEHPGRASNDARRSTSCITVHYGSQEIPIGVEGVNLGSVTITPSSSSSVSRARSGDNSHCHVVAGQLPSIHPDVVTPCGTYCLVTNDC